MLGDKSIRRDGLYPFPLRVLLAMRKKIAPVFRADLNAQIKDKLSGVSYSIFGNNCLAGVFYHDAGTRLTSPTINTAMDAENFIRFCENPKHYFDSPMTFIAYEGHNYPIALIDDIEVRFVHYQTVQEAEKKWRERAQRIVWENIFVVATNQDGFNTPEMMARFDNLPYENKIMFVSEEYPEYPWAILVPQFKNRFQVRIMTAFANFRGQRYYETCFDLAQWIRECSENDQILTR